MTEERYWRLVKVSQPYGKYYSAHITCAGYDHNEETTNEEGSHLAKERLLARLKAMGHVVA